MKPNGEVMDSSTMVSKILRSLTPKFNYVVCSTEESNDLSKLSVDELHGSLLVHEQWMQESQPDEQVLKLLMITDQKQVVDTIEEVELVVVFMEEVTKDNHWIEHS